MNKEQEKRYAIALQIVDYYSTTNKYIRSKLHSNAHQTVFTKENDKYQWLVLEQKNQSEIEVRQTDRHGFPKTFISYRKSRKLSEEQRRQAREHMQKINSYNTL